MLLREIATRDVARLDAHASLSDAAATMAARSISSIVVVDAGQRPLGIVTEQTFVEAMQAGLSADLPLADVMSAAVSQVPDDIGLQDAYLACLHSGAKHLILVDGQGGLAGIVSETDFRLHLKLTALTGQKHAGAIMTRSLLKIAPGAPFAEVLALMTRHRGSCVVVVENERPVGIVTQRDLVRLFPRQQVPAQLDVRAVMSAPVATVGLDTTLQDIASRMLDAHLRHLVVVDEHGVLAGLISEHELMQNMVYGLVEAQLQADRSFLRTLLDAIPDLVWIKDAGGTYLACNTAFERLYDVGEQQLVGRSDADFVAPELAAFFRENDRKAVHSRQTVRNEEWLQFSSDGYEGLFETAKTPVCDDTGRLIGVLGIARDISERKRAETALQESQALLRAVVDSTGSPVWSVDAENFGLLTFNARMEDDFREHCGITLVRGMRPDVLYPPGDYPQRWYGFYRRTLREERFSVEYASFTGQFTLRLNFNLLRRDGKVFGISVFAEDITERKASEARIDFLANYDALTGLPNSNLARERFRLAASYADRSDARLALLLLDLDRFKDINDALSHRCGDRLLVAVAERLSARVREADTVSRTGGDEFLIILTDVRDPHDVAPQARRILDDLARPVDIDGRMLSVTGSIGIAIYPDDAGDMDTLMQMADTALFAAKDAGRNDFHFCDERSNTAALELLNLRHALSTAVETQQLVLHYQPQVALDSGVLIGAEALVRWQSPTRGLVPPADFIPLAEDSGMIVPIGAWVLREACRQAARWRRQPALATLNIAVNVAAAQFLRGNLEQTVRDALDESGLDPHALTLEITESTLIRDPESVLEIVRRIKTLGVGFAIDDFGTGYSSLSYLKRFPIDKLKIDQSFVRNMARDSEDVEIVRATIQMARALHMHTIAEGIEDGATAHRLLVLQCEEGQGYHWARPLPAGEFERFAVAHSPATGADCA